MIISRCLTLATNDLDKDDSSDTFQSRAAALFNEVLAIRAESGNPEGIIHIQIEFETEERL